jgi:hypothetical protein
VPSGWVLVVFSTLSNLADDSVVGRLLQARKERDTMHDLLIALAFIGMVVAPAIVAANVSEEKTDESN